MKRSFIYLLVTLIFSVSSSYANNIVNPGFEDKWNGWGKVDKKGNALGISGDAKSGSHSAKITKKTGYFAQVVTVDPNKNYELSAQILGYGVLATKVGPDVYYERLKKAKKWKKVSVKFNSKEAKKITIFAQNPKCAFYPCKSQKGVPWFLKGQKFEIFFKKVIKGGGKMGSNTKIGRPGE